MNTTALDVATRVALYPIGWQDHRPTEVGGLHNRYGESTIASRRV
ncbi:MAG TPA: hypothetical protein VGK48_27280 [Terriglobia bacterium]